MVDIGAIGAVCSICAGTAGGSFYVNRASCVVRPPGFRSNGESYPGYECVVEVGREDVRRRKLRGGALTCSFRIWRLTLGLEMETRLALAPRTQIPPHT